MRAASFGGSAMRVPAFLAAARAVEGRVDRYDGVSAGALIAGMLAAGRLDEFEALVMRPGLIWRVMRPSCAPWRRGLLSLAPLLRTVEAAELRPDAFQVPVFAHVVDLQSEEPGTIAIPLHDLPDARAVAAALVASCAQAGLHEPVWLEHGGPAPGWYADGGAWCPVAVPGELGEGDELAAVAASPLFRPWGDRLEPESVGLFRGLEYLLGHPARRSARALRAGARRGASVVYAAPARRGPAMGAAWDARLSTRRHRRDVVGPAMWHARRRVRA